jgi:hypothetical protein
MHLMLTNKGPTPLPIGTGQAGGYENLLPPGLEIAFAQDEVTTLVFGEQPEAAGRSKFHALQVTEVDPESPLAVEYATDIDQWKGRSDETAETAEMTVSLFVKNVGYNDVTVTTTDGPTVLKHSEGVLIETIAGTVTEGEPGAGTPPDTGGGPEPGVTVSGFTATQDPTVTVAGGEITNGDTIALTATGGDPDAQAKINGYSGVVYEASGGSARLSNLDLTGYIVDGLTASAVITPVADTSGTITAFTAANPTEASMDAEDEGMLVVGGILTLEAKAGDPAAMAVIDGQIVEVLSKAPVTLGIDLSAVDVTGLTADFVVG